MLCSSTFWEGKAFAGQNMIAVGTIERVTVRTFFPALVIHDVAYCYVGVAFHLSSQHKSSTLGGEHGLPDGFAGDGDGGKGLSSSDGSPVALPFSVGLSVPAVMEFASGAHTSIAKHTILG